jgi:uncharacterized spore protein YtfJ
MADAGEIKGRVEAQLARGEFLERLAQRVGASAQASAVFGEPVERGGVTVIPVAKATWGVGGGTGQKAGEQGLVGGGGTSVSPVGYIEIRDTGAEFKPIRDPLRLAAVAAAGVGAAALAARAISRR